MLSELGDGVSRGGLLKRDATYFVIDESGDCFDLEHVTVVHSQFFDVFVGLFVVPQRRSRVLFQLAEKGGFELMPNEKELVSGFVEKLAIRFNSTSFRVVIVLRHLVESAF